MLKYKVMNLTPATAKQAISCKLLVLQCASKSELFVKVGLLDMIAEDM